MRDMNGAGFVGLQRRFEEWRRLRQRGGRIPEALWSAAVQVAREHGVSRTSQRLRLDYYALKRRLQALNRESEPVEFVEVTPKALSSSPEVVVELRDDQGWQLRIELRDPASAEALARSLWRERR